MESNFRIGNQDVLEFSPLRIAQWNPIRLHLVRWHFEFSPLRIAQWNPISSILSRLFGWFSPLRIAQWNPINKGRLLATK